MQDFDVIILEKRMQEDMLVQAYDYVYNKANRHAAYGQYILWIIGHFSAGMGTEELSQVV